MWSQEVVDTALQLLSTGRTTRSVATEIGVPRRTIADWANSTTPIDRGRHKGEHSAEVCQLVLEPDWLALTSYVYLLGLYLGDGCLSAHPRGVWRLRIFCDTKYPGIIEICASAMRSVYRRTGCSSRREAAAQKSRCTRGIGAPFPQHGPVEAERGPAHGVRQERLVGEDRAAFLRGLVHSDGSRYIARQTCRGHRYAWPRYCFSNLSEDIKHLFCETCDALGIAWRRADPKHIYINRRGAVAVMDELAGPKLESSRELLRVVATSCMFPDAMAVEKIEVREGYHIEHPNQEKAANKATKAVVILLLLASVGLMLIVTLGGWSKLAGMQIVPSATCWSTCSWPSTPPAGTAASCRSSPRSPSSSRSSRRSPGRSGSSATRPASAHRRSTRASSASSRC